MRPAASEGRHLRESLALWTFVGVAACAFAFYTLIYGRDLYIGTDNLLLLTGRPAGIVGSLFGAFTTHWVTIPFLIEAGLMKVFGLGNAIPYVAVGTAAWVAGASLVRVIARQAGVGPWTATIAAISVLTCADIYPQRQPHSFQVALAVAFGLGQVALANSRRYSGVRVAMTILIGLLGLMTSAAAVSFVAAAGLVIWVRRGLRQALLVLVPLAVVFVSWYLLFGTRQIQELPSSVWDKSVVDWLAWMIAGYKAAFMALAGWRVLAGALVVVTVAGSGVAWLRGQPVPRRDLVAPAALALVGVVHLLNAFVIRFWIGSEGATHGRFVYVTVLSLLPQIAVAISALATVWRPFAALSLLLIVAVPGNIVSMRGEQQKAVASTTSQAQRIVSLASSPDLDGVPGWVRPDPIPNFLNGLAMTDVAFLRGLRESGHLPLDTPPLDRYEAQVPVRLGLALTAQSVPLDAICRQYQVPTVIRGTPGYQFGVVGAGVGTTQGIEVGLPGDPDSLVPFGTQQRLVFEVTLPRAYLVRAQDGVGPYTICRW